MTRRDRLAATPETAPPRKSGAPRAGRRASVPFRELVGRADYERVGLDVVLTEAALEEPRGMRLNFAVLPSRLPPTDAEQLLSREGMAVAQLLSSGYEHVIDIIPPGVQLHHAPTLHASAVAELALHLVMSSLNHAPTTLRAQREGTWIVPPPRQRLSATTVLIIGVGAVGQALEALLSGFAPKLIRVARSRRSGVHPVADLDRLLPQADVVVIAAALNVESSGLFNDERLSRMRAGAVLVNVARGEIVDMDALVQHVAAGRLRAALDVTDPEPLPQGHPLWGLPGAIVTPHVGGRTDDFRERAVEYLDAQLLRYARGELLLHPVPSATFALRRGTS